MFDPTTYKVNENDRSVEVCVKMEKNCIGAFNLPLNTADGPNEDRRAVGEYYCSVRRYTGYTIISR